MQENHEEQIKPTKYPPLQGRGCNFVSRIPLASHTAPATTWMASLQVKASQESSTLIPSCNKKDK